MHYKTNIFHHRTPPMPFVTQKIKFFTTVRPLGFTFKINHFFTKTRHLGKSCFWPKRSNFSPPYAPHYPPHQKHNLFVDFLLDFLRADWLDNHAFVRWWYHMSNQNRKIPKKYTKNTLVDVHCGICFATSDVLYLITPAWPPRKKRIF